MNKDLLVKLIPALLGFAGILVPNMGFEYGPVSIWLFGLIAQSDGNFDDINFGKSQQYVPMPVVAVLFGAGATIALLAALGVLNLDKVAWLPGAIMLSGVATYFIALAGTEIFMGTPVVLGIACAATGGVWSLVNAIKAGKPA